MLSWKRRTKLVSTILIGLVLGSVCQTPSRAATVEEVDTAIRKACDFIYSKQQGANWEAGSDPTVAQFTGQTALAIYALLSAGEKPANNPKLAAAIEWLKKNDTKGIYALGCRAQVWYMLPHDKDEVIRDCIRKDAALLLEGARNSTGTGFRGLYHYLVSSRTYDSSCSQYGVLGMWGLERAGLEVSDDYWTAVEKAWTKNQQRDGNWVYGEGEKTDLPATRKVNMTAAGIATLFITQDYLRSMDGVKCTPSKPSPALEKGMAWMEKNLPAMLKAGQVAPYGMYGIERIGVASGYKYFGNVDWYKDGSDDIAKKLNKSKTGGLDTVVNTSFCILFLSRGRAPVVMNKLQYDIDKKEANWNVRPRDAANGVRYIAKQMERDLNWQIVNLNVPVEELHDSPILYIAGNQALKFTEAEEAKLKAFVEQGGLILGHADCADPAFTKSFKALGMKLFKDAGEFRALDPGHPIYTRQQFLFKNWKNKPDLQGLSNKVRELMLLIPSGDPGKAWQQADNKAKEDQFQLLSDIFLYAVEGKDLRYKGATYLVTANPAIKTTQTIKVARLDVGENSNPEPGGWARLSAVMHNKFGVDVETAMVKPDGDALKDYKVAHITGTGKIKLKDDQQAAIKAFVEGGGTLIIDAAGGDTEFGAAMEDALHTMFGDDAKQLSGNIPSSHALYNAGGLAIDTNLFRAFARGKVPRGQTTPLIRGISLKDRLAVIISREDISGGLVGESVDGILGYNPEVATALMTNLLAYANGGIKALPTSKPTTAPAAKPAATKPATKPAAPAPKPKPEPEAAKPDEPAAEKDKEAK